MSSILTDIFQPDIVQSIPDGIYPGTQTGNVVTFVATNTTYKGFTPASTTSLDIPVNVTIAGNSATVERIDLF